MVNQDPLFLETPGESTCEAKVGEVIPPETATNITEQPGGSSEVIEAVAETSEPLKPSDEIKVVIVLKDKRGMVGIQSPECDPVMTTLEGTLETILERVPSFVEEAKQQWATNPRHPQSTIPEPAPPPPPARTATPAGKRSATPKPHEPTTQRLF